MYDPDSRFLVSVLNFASRFLAPNGRLLVIYSDLARELGLHGEDFIEQKCRERGLEVVSAERRAPMEVSSSSDALKNYKQRASVVVYEIVKI